MDIKFSKEQQAMKPLKDYTDGSNQSDEDIGNGTENPMDSDSPTEEDSVDLRGSWSGRFEFLLSVVGYTVGLGNIWRFPYLCLRNGGGAFLIPFFIFLALCGGPMYYLEVCLGQFSGKSPIIVWEICPLFKGIGAMMVFTSALFIWYFGIVFAWAIYFLFCSFYPRLGWTTCGHWWNTPQCIDGSEDLKKALTIALNNTLNSTSAVYNVSSENITAESLGLRTAGTEFWLFNVLRLSPGIEELGGIQWHLAGASFVGWFLTFVCLAKGVKSMGKVVYVTATAPYLLLTVLLIRGVTLEGAADGLKLYLTPDFERLAHGQVWMDAAVQVFYSLGAAWGCVITMASFNKFHDKSVRVTVIVCFADAFTAFFGGLVVFSVLGFLAKETGLPLNDLVKSGPGLAFIVYPEALGRLPIPNLWSVLFFFTLLIIGIDTQFATFETVCNAVIDLFFDKLHKHKLWISLGLALFMFLSGLVLTTRGGYYVFLLSDWYCAAFAILFTALLEVIIIAWIYGASRFSEDIAAMAGTPPLMVTRMSWCIVLPFILIVMLAMSVINYGAPYYGKDGYVFPDYAVAIGNVIAFFPVFLLIVGALMEILKQKGGLLQRLGVLLRSGRSWVPNDRKQREIYAVNPYVYQTNIWRRVREDVFGFR